MNIVINETYNQKNDRKNRKFRKYAQIIIRAAQVAELFVYNQMLIIYNDLDIEFQKNFPISKQITSFNFFLTIFDERKKI